jgi:hypothetical protein
MQSRAGGVMSNDKAWELDSLGRRVGPYKKEEILDLESRVDWSERFVSQHDRDIRQIRYEAAKVAQQLQGQIQEQAQLIKGLRRLVGFLARAFFAVIAALFAWLVFSYVPDEILFSYVPDEIFSFVPNGIYWKAGSALFVFLITVLMGNLLFRRRAASLFREPPRKQEISRNRRQSSRR